MSRHRIKFPQELRELGVFTAKEAELFGITRRSLSYLVTKEVLLRVDSGVYWLKESSVKAEQVDFIAACLRIGPSAVVGGHTALFRYGLIREVPERIWVFVPQGNFTRSPHQYKVIRTKNDLTLGVEVYPRFKITNIERTLLDSLRYQKKIGLSLAYEAFHAASRENLTNMRKLGLLAKELGWENLLLKHWAALSMEIDNLT